MRCPNCGEENDESSAFCTQCGKPFESEVFEDQAGPEPAERAVPSEDPAFAQLQREVRALRLDILNIQTTLSAQGIPLSLQRPGPAQPPLREPAPAAAGVASTAVPAGAASERAQPQEPPQRREDREPAPALWERLPVDWEAVLGGNWLARIGVLAVVVGAGFFLKLAFDNNWIGETGRVALGIVGGLAMLGGGEYWRKRYAVYAQALAGGGVALLYLSVFAAFALYDLIDLSPAVGLLLLISVASAALAIRHESVTLAIIGIVGAFGAPFILDGSSPSTREVARTGSNPQLLGYIIVVDFGVLALSTFRNWRWFTVLALLGSLAAFGLWNDQYGDSASLLISQGSLTIIFLIFMGATTLFHIVWRRAPQAFDQSLMVINVAAYIGITYGLLWDDFRLWMGGFTLLLSLFYGGFAYVVLLRSREHVYLSFMALGIALVLLTIAVPVQVGGPWVSVAWAVEGAVLIWLSFNLRMWQLKVFGVGIFAIFAFVLLFLDTPDALSARLTPFLNRYFPAYLVSIGATYVAAYLLWRYKDQLEDWEQVPGLRRYKANLRVWERGLFPAFLVAGNVFLTVAVPVQVDGAWIAVTWAVEALALMWLSFRLGFVELRLFSLGVFATMAVRLLFFDTPADLRVWDPTSQHFVSDFRLILNYPMLAFASGVSALYLAFYLVRRAGDAVEDWEKKYVPVALLAAASSLTLWILSAELIAAVDSGMVAVSGSAEGNVKSLGLSLLWAAYASVTLVLGIAKGWRMVRLAALALLAIPILKLFLVDSFALEQGYRVAAFLILGTILLAGGFLYQRFSVSIREYLFENAPASTNP